MLTPEQQKEILDSIASSGRVEEKEIKINSNINHVLSFSSGAARIQSTFVRKAQLILSQPAILQSLSNFQIRCALCHRVISYPAWYYNIKYSVNQFHYFVCFDNLNPTKPTARCYRKV